MDIAQILQLAVQQGASDVHIVVGVAPHLRVHGKLIPIPGEPAMVPERSAEMLMQLVNPTQKDVLMTNRELDFSFALGNQARFRVNIYFEKGAMGAALRL